MNLKNVTDNPMYAALLVAIVGLLGGGGGGLIGSVAGSLSASEVRSIAEGVVEDAIEEYAVDVERDATVQAEADKVVRDIQSRLETKRQQSVLDRIGDVETSLKRFLEQRIDEIESRTVDRVYRRELIQHHKRMAAWEDGDRVGPRPQLSPYPYDGLNEKGQRTDDERRTR